MNGLEVAASRAIHSSRRAISEAVVERQYALHPELRDRYGERGREKCVEDTEYHLAHLSGALLASSPALFADYIGWAAGVMTVAGIRTEDVRENLACLRDILGERLPEGMAGVAAGYVESALERLAEPPPEVPSFLPAGRGARRARRGVPPPAAGLRAARRRPPHPGRRGLGRGDPGCLPPGLPALPAGTRPAVAGGPDHRRPGALLHGGHPADHVPTRPPPLRHRAERASGRRHLRGRRGARGRPPMVADLLELAGWDTIYLGGNVPARGVVQALAEHRADLLAVSATMTYHLPAVIDLIAAVRAEPACAGVKVMVGGRLFDAEPGLWRRVGADGHAADADEACRIADRLMPNAGRPTGAGAAGIGRRPGAEPAGPCTATESRDDLSDEMGRVNSEVVALNRELARRNAEVERLHAQVSRQAELLTEADRRKDEFLAMLAHELRNPLAPIRNALQVLRRPRRPTRRRSRAGPGHDGAAGPADGPAGRRPAGRVPDHPGQDRAAQGAGGPGRGGAPTPWRPAGPLIEAAGHELTVSLPAEPIRLEADPTRLAQVFANLLNNAAKYTEPGGRIWPDRRAARGARSSLRVRDTGIGIAAEMLPRVFELFAQVGPLARAVAGRAGHRADAGADGWSRCTAARSRPTARGRARAASSSSGCPSAATAARAGSTGGRQAGRERPGWLRRRILVVDDNWTRPSSLAMLLRALTATRSGSAHDGPAAAGGGGGVPARRGPARHRHAGDERLRGGPAAAEQPCGRRHAARGPDRLGPGGGPPPLAGGGFDHHLVKPVDPDTMMRLLDDLQTTPA